MLKTTEDKGPESEWVSRSKKTCSGALDSQKIKTQSGNIEAKKRNNNDNNS